MNMQAINLLLTFYIGLNAPPVPPIGDYLWVDNAGDYMVDNTGVNFAFVPGS